MQEDWRDMPEYYGYIISDFGRVRSVFIDSCLKQYFNQNGVPTVILSGDGRQHHRSVPLLVARHWLPEPEREDFISPIHLDGIRSNCHADNLAWRPRWFSINFHRERLQNPFPNWNADIEVIETGEIFPNPRACSLKYGVMEIDIYHSIFNDRIVFPQDFRYRLA